jgi:alpha-tubulin suppressor-like RCC1 family protein
LGIGNTGTRTSPVQVGSETDWEKISGGAQHSLAIKSNGTLWAWGANTNGQLGLGNIVNRSSPVQVGTETDWLMVTCGQNFSMAIRGSGSSGSLWAWGYNAQGRLGLGNSASRSSPVQVGTDTDWAIVTAGYIFAVAVKTNGTIWSWGNNTYGRLGLNDPNGQISRSSPVQIGSLTDWATSAGSLSSGINTISVKNGKLYGWGAGLNGTLATPLIFPGPTTRPYSTSPIQISTLGGWKNVSIYAHLLGTR